MREVRSLRPTSDTTLAAMKPAWGTPQRFCVAGSVVFVLATIAAVILYRQFPAPFVGLPSPQAERQFVQSLPTLETIRYFRLRILPGIDIAEPAGSQRQRGMVNLGLAALAGLGAIGLILTGVGLAGIVRRWSAGI